MTPKLAPTQGQYNHHVPKGWGYEFWVANSPLYCGKVLHFNDGKKCSWHYHRKKDETFYVMSGTIQLAYGWTDRLDSAEYAMLSKGDTFHVPVGLRHQMTAVNGDAEIFEVSTQHFNEDSIRVIPGD